MNFKTRIVQLLVIAIGLWCGVPFVRAQERIPLIAPADAVAGWRFNNGQEFPGATGGVTLDKEAGRPNTLKVVGDFTKGGNYVDIGRPIDRIDIRELSMWVRNPDADHFTLRSNDASGQTHQINLKTAPTPDWQLVTFPLERFFARMGQADAVTNVSKYESWGGAKDGAWHGPATALYILVGRTGKVRTLWLNDIAILPRLEEVAGPEIRIVLDEIVEGAHEWRFSRGEEFPGAKGALSVVKDLPGGKPRGFKLAGDFTGGGAYVAAIREFKDLEAKEFSAVSMQVKTGNAASVNIQLVDATGQTHQRKNVPLIADDQWHPLVIKPGEIAGGEHWGGANDGKWHGIPARFTLSLSDRSDAKTKMPLLYLTEIRAEARMPVFARPPAFGNDFEGASKLGADWTMAGDVALDAKTAFKGTRSLVLSRSLENIGQPSFANSPAFPVVPGRWEVRFAGKAALHSPDNSYHAAIDLECLDEAGKSIERISLAELFGEKNWQPFAKQIELPKGSVSARFITRLNKAYGRFWIDEISAAYLAPARRTEERISRLLFSSPQLGNLLYPGDPRRFGIVIEARKPLADDQRVVTCVVRDYWGAEQMQPVRATLAGSEKKGGLLIYSAEIDLGNIPLEVGRYYELHAAAGMEGGEPFRNHTSFAILPEAETKQYSAAEVPFASRSWDNRLPEYVKLSDRLGVRMCGIWGGWSAKAPYKPEAPSLELAAKLGMSWLTGTPIQTIEQGKSEYSEEALRHGVRNLIEAFGKVSPMTINLGNEPHGTGARVLANVAAYRAVYEEAKRVDPSITVVATSVEPNEEYFKAGYGKWCDAFDFHIYETAADVRRTIGEYRQLMEKYGVVKPIWSTELGLNSQGQTRQAVAGDLIRKFATFFAAGGERVSWFGLLYPDTEGKNHGNSGDSHNIFDCRYNRYAPRLDAVAYYNGVNAIGIKRFMAERNYPGNISAFLFRDRAGHSLQVLWKEKGRQDVFIPLKGTGAVQVIRIDGSRRKLNAGANGITLTLGEDPLLLLYESAETTLPETFGSPIATLEPPREGIRRGVPAIIKVAGSGDVDLVAPPFWVVNKAPSTSGIVTFTVTPPSGSALHHADLTFILGNANGSHPGELYLHCPVSE